MNVQICEGPTTRRGRLVTEDGRPVLIDMHEDYNRELRWHRRKKLAAKIGMTIAVALVAFGFGTFLAVLSMTQVLFTLLIVAQILWGIWGFYYDTTRH
jgi:hypothetical protein